MFSSYMDTGIGEHLGDRVQAVSEGKRSDQHVEKVVNRPPTHNIRIQLD